MMHLHSEGSCMVAETEVFTSDSQSGLQPADAHLLVTQEFKHREITLLVIIGVDLLNKAELLDQSPAQAGNQVLHCARLAAIRLNPWQL